MNYAETSRLILRSLDKSDLPQIVELLGDWDVARWLVQVPFPYSLSDAEDYYERMRQAIQKGAPEYFLLEHKKDRKQIGAIGLHPSRELSPQPGELVVGYWLGKAYWGQGFMSEALQPVIDIAFTRPDVLLVTATTDPTNNASQNVLKRSGLSCIGVSQSRDPSALRGSKDFARWRLTRDDYEQRKKKSA